MDVPGIQPQDFLIQILHYIQGAPGVGVWCVIGFFVCLFERNLIFLFVPRQRKAYYYTAGGSDIQRPRAEAKRIWRTIPPQIRAQGHRKLSAFHSNKDWSHIVSRQNGGSDSADNGIFEYRWLNRRRGGRNMSPIELAMAQSVLIVLAVRTTLVSTVKVALLGAMTGTALAALPAIQDLPLEQLTGDFPRILTRALMQEGMRGFEIAFLTTGGFLTLPSLIDFCRRSCRFLYRSLRGL